MFNLKLEKMKSIEKLSKFGLNHNLLNIVNGGLQTGGGTTYTTCKDNTKNPSAGTCDEIIETIGDNGVQIAWSKCEWKC
jgi:hypothetical protein